MKKISPILLGLSLAIAGSSFAVAQDATSIPKILQITREFTKPYKGGAAHDKTESAFIAAAARAKFPVYYVALNSLSGKSRALFLTSYDSFADWEKGNKLVDNNPTLAADFERAGLADGELLDEVDSEVFTGDMELSLHPRGDLSHARFVEISVFKVKPGHNEEFRKLTKLWKDADDKAGSSYHWGAFEAAYGVDDGTFIEITGHQSMDGVDKEFSEDKSVRNAMGEEGLKEARRLSESALESSHSELFTINPKQSYVSPDWIKADPDFWKPKPAAKAAMPEKKATP
ncbi:MAG: hypothetical protein ACLPY1_21925 [Terracidiphilus sp.]